MGNSTTIWVTDDQADIRFIFNQALTHAGYSVVEFKHGMEVIEGLEHATPALVILDVKMPQMDGWETLKGLRQQGFAGPVLMVTSENDLDSRVRGLEAGADDYVGKPCAPMELVARVGALLRRVPKSPAHQPPLKLGDVVIDFQRKVAEKAGQPLRLTRTDFAVLALLNAHAGSVVSRETILGNAWPEGAGNSHALDTHIWRLRKKLGDTDPEPRWIKSVPALGYIMTP